MVNQDILTSLKNAVERGQSLESAINIAISSGYNPREVEEASQFIGGVSSRLHVKSDEELTMPSQKTKISPAIPSQAQIQQEAQKIKQQVSEPPAIQPPDIQTMPTPQPKPVQEPESIQPQVKTEPVLPQKTQQQDLQTTPTLSKKQKIKRQSYTKEIVLLIILLLLIGILVFTIFFREKILGWFSGA